MGFADLAPNFDPENSGSKPRETKESSASPASSGAGETASVALEEGLAATALAFEDFRAVIRHCSRIVQVQQEHFEAWFNLGYARQQVGELEEAVFAYHRSSRLRPSDARPLVNLGLVRQTLNDSEGAGEAYREALQADPGHPQALWNLALLVEADGEYAEAESYYARLEKILPDDEEVLFRLGLTRLYLEEPEGAVEAFDACIRRKPGWKEAQLNRGLALAACGRHAEAKAMLNRVLESDPRSEEALCGLAAVAVESADWDTALAVRKQLLEARGSLPELTYNLALALDQQGRTEEAIRFYCEAIKERPKFPEALLNLGHALDRLGRHTEAVECWKRAMGLNSAYATAYFRAKE
ncbi:MAG: tetratricopeptide repeat protein [Bryobacteraceae bacterium]